MTQTTTQYFIRRMTRRNLSELLAEIEAEHGVFALDNEDGVIIKTHDGVPVLRAVNVGEPLLICVLHKSIFQEPSCPVQ